MIIKSHLCGIAVAFERFEDATPEDWKSEYPAGKFFDYSAQGRPQGSHYSQQKRKIADACEFMRLKPQHEPIIFVATSPGFTDMANEKKLIQKLTHNLRNGYACKNYVWVREATQMGFPHFHFIADMPRFDVVALSLYWSRLFGVNAPNSIRLGTAPGRNGKRIFTLKAKRMSWYLTKYLGKSIGSAEKGANKTARVRTFAVSQELAKLSQPVEFKSKMIRQETGRHAMTVHGLVPLVEDIRIFQNCTSAMTETEVREKWNWQYTGFANTYKGFPKEWKLKPKKQ